MFSNTEVIFIQSFMTQYIVASLSLSLSSIKDHFTEGCQFTKNHD